MLTERDRSLIRTSYAALAADAQGAGELFYEFLFADDPDLRALFVIGMSEQSGKLMSTLGIVVSQLQDWEGLAAMVEDLAIRHVAYGVKEDHYAAVGTALIRMLSARSPGQIDQETLDAWGRAYNAIADAMIRAAYHERDSVRAVLNPGPGS